MAHRRGPHSVGRRFGYRCSTYAVCQGAHAMYLVQCKLLAASCGATCGRSTGRLCRVWVVGAHIDPPAAVNSLCLSMQHTSGSLVGFGDITPVTFYEIGFTVLFVSFGTLVYLYILAEITVGFLAFSLAFVRQSRAHVEHVGVRCSPQRSRRGVQPAHGDRQFLPQICTETACWLQHGEGVTVYVVLFMSQVNYFIGEHWQLSDTHASKERKVRQLLMVEGKKPFLNCYLLVVDPRATDVAGGPCARLRDLPVVSST